MDLQKWKEKALPYAVIGVGVGVVVAIILIVRKKRRIRIGGSRQRDGTVDRFILHSEELLRERRMIVISQPVRLESEVIQGEESQDSDKSKQDQEEGESKAEVPVPRPVPTDVNQGVPEERAAYRLCYEHLDMYMSDSDPTQLDEEEGYFNELEEWPTDTTNGLSISLGSLPPSDAQAPNGETQKGEEKAPLKDSDFEEGGRLVDWNERFQVIVGKLRASNFSTPLVERFDTNRALIHLAQDFIYSSSSYGKIIISEVFVPMERKTIKPIPLGGLVGGEKYIVHNILFKFALDSNGLYGSDYAASKVAGHELKGLMAYFNAGVKDLCLPLMALIDYRGFRLIAMSILPINKGTIVYGSNDYGKTIHADNPDVNDKMRIAAEVLNIKPHMCGISPETSKQLWSPADLEVHRGTDHRHYLLDFSRVMPPEFPKHGVKMAHLFRLLRPEFVRNYPVPLCSDGFSGFIRVHNPDVHNAELEKATNYLTTVLVPAYASQLQRLIFEAKEKGDLENFRLTDAVHSAGINIRYIGILRHHMTDRDCKTLLFVEMCARVVKNNLRLRLRERMRKLRLPLDEPYHRLVVDYLNLILGHNDQSEEYWTKNLKSSLMRKFDLGLTVEEAEHSFPLKCILDYFSDNSMDGKLLLFNRIQKICGLKFSSRLNEEFSKHKNFWVSRGEQPLDDTDLEEIGLRVKHMNIVTYAQGYALHLKGNMAWGSNPLNAQRFYKMALEKFEEALSTDPTNSDMLCHCAEISVRFLEGEEKNLANLSFSLSHPLAKAANMYFRRAINANPADSYALYQYAQFLDKCGEVDEAEEFYLRSLEINPNNAAGLQEYGNFLTLRKGCHEDAERFFLRSSKCTELYLASEQALTIEVNRRGMTRHTRHGSNTDFLQLMKQEDNDFRERARSEIDLCSSPTLRFNSDEVMVTEGNGRDKGKEKRRSSLGQRVLFGSTDEAGGATTTSTTTTTTTTATTILNGSQDGKEMVEGEGEDEAENEGTMSLEDDENGYENYQEEAEDEDENGYENYVEEEAEEEKGDTDETEEDTGEQGRRDEDEHGGEVDMDDYGHNRNKAPRGRSMYSEWSSSKFSEAGEEKEKIRE